LCSYANEVLVCQAQRLLHLNQTRGMATTMASVFFLTVNTSSCPCAPSKMLLTYPLCQTFPVTRCRHPLHSQTFFNFLSQRHNRLGHFISDTMHLSLSYRLDWILNKQNINAGAQFIGVMVHIGCLSGMLINSLSLTHLCVLHSSRMSMSLSSTCRNALKERSMKAGICRLASPAATQK